MKKAVWSGIIVAVGMLALSTPVFAQASANASVSVTANINAKAKLNIDSASITFPAVVGDPDSTPSISATALGIDVKARTTANGSVTLTVVATDDLKAGTATIAISNLTWASSGTNFAGSGTSNTVTPQTVASFTGSGSYSGSQTYALANSWAYSTGTYTTSLTYTLTAP
jgi:hypothetical protein